ncbi:MAG: hypothetical protein HC915_01995 [Anaerolineae bacterium]|nr:hypothetical protein [Anaerolineae bacterium]
MSEQETLAVYSNALQELAGTFYAAAQAASQRIISNLRIDALRHEASLTERFWAYLRVGLGTTKGGRAPAHEADSSGLYRPGRRLGRGEHWRRYGLLHSL